MRLYIQHQESYSRGQLLLRAFFGIFYIGIPHFFMMAFCGIYAAILGFISWWAILFTGTYPKSFFEYQAKFMNWQLRVIARFLNLVDGYPAFFPAGTDEQVKLEVPYPETSSRGLLLLRAFFGIIYVYIPHGFILYFRMLWAQILTFIGFWAILFTGKFPASMHSFIVANLRWSTRVSIYMANMSDEYPPFHGRETSVPANYQAAHQMERV